MRSDSAKLRHYFLKIGLFPAAIIMSFFFDAVAQCPPPLMEKEVVDCSCTCTGNTYSYTAAADECIEHSVHNGKEVTCEALNSRALCVPIHQFTAKVTLPKTLYEDENPMPKYVYKSLTPNEWEIFQKEKVFKGSALDIKDGFIHMSHKEQLSRVLKKFMAGQPEVIIVKIETKKLGEGLKFESNKPNGNIYPHLYGPLPFDAVASHERRKL